MRFDILYQVGGATCESYVFQVRKPALNFPEKHRMFFPGSDIRPGVLIGKSNITILSVADSAGTDYLGIVYF